MPVISRSLGTTLSAGHRDCHGHGGQCGGPPWTRLEGGPGPVGAPGAALSGPVFTVNATTPSPSGRLAESDRTAGHGRRAGRAHAVTVR